MLGYYHHLGDWAAACGHLSWDEDQAYTQLVRAYYLTERPIPANLDVACHLVGAHTFAEREATKRVLAQFFTKTEAGYVNKRCEKELIHGKSRKARAQKAAVARWHPSQEDSPEHVPGAGAPSIAASMDDKGFPECKNGHSLETDLRFINTDSTPGEVPQNEAIRPCSPYAVLPQEQIQNTSTTTTTANNETAARLVVVAKQNGFKVSEDGREITPLLTAGYSESEFVEAISAAQGKPWGWVTARMIARHPRVENALQNAQNGLRAPERVEVGGRTQWDTPSASSAFYAGKLHTGEGDAD